MAGLRCPSCGFLYRLGVAVSGGWTCGHCGWTGTNIFSTEGDGMGITIPWDVVTLRIKAEKQMQVETVRVFVSGNLLSSGEDTAKTKASLAAALSKVIDAPWALTTARRGEDPSGMERVSVAASVRVKEHLTAGLVERLKQASRAGLQLHLDRIATRPPRSEMDKVIEGLRHEIYERAKSEADILNSVLPAEEGKWRVGEVDFAELDELDDHPQRPIRDMPSVRYQSMQNRAEENAEPDLPVTTRATLEAKVRLKRLSIAPPEHGFFSEG
jgi:hypothetical protein